MRQRMITIRYNETQNVVDLTPDSVATNETAYDQADLEIHYLL